MNDPTETNRLPNKFLNFVFRFGHHMPLAIQSSKLFVAHTHTKYA